MKKLKYLITLTLVTALFVFSSCEKEDDDPMDQPTPELLSIAEIASDNEDFSILVEALIKADLVSTLSNTGNFTVFAPENDAFNALFTTLGVRGISDISAEDLKPILLYHVLGETKSSSMITDGYYSSLSPAQGRTLSMYIGTGMGVSINGSANVSSADIEASNGVIHAIDAVLLPPNVVDLAVQNGSFGTLVSAVVGAGLAETLSDAAGTFTVFAPTDDAFAALGDNVPADLTPILLYHVLGSPVYSDEISSGIINSLNESDPEIVVEVSDMGVMLNGSANVIATDIVGTNGVIHVIDQLILPINNQSILDAAMGLADFSSLVAALAKANLASTFMMDGAFTVFAPTNDAFAAFLESANLAFEDLTAEALAPILKYHVLGSKALSGSLATGYVNTIYEAQEGYPVTLYVEVDGGVKLNANINVTAADVETSNGLIHVIDGVLSPTSVVDIAINNSSFTQLVAAVVKAGLVETLSEAGPFTIFAPTDDAFAQLYVALGVSGIEEIDAATLIPILQYHVVSGNVLSSDLSEGDVTTLNGAISIVLGESVTINGSTEVIATDVQGTNGVVHVIDEVLLPQ
ncbi:MAG: fasciclin domain-containing protein [Bacteroidales bacterium]|nr:fasciclin domain-containing protein [Bacteroidales bacterium]